MSTVASAVSCSPVVIEQSTWRDLNALRRLEQVCFPKDAWPLWDLVAVLTLPNVVRLKAVCQEQMVGLIAADIRHSENLAWIATLGVLPEYRGQGIGAALLAACEGRLAMPRVRLCVRISNQPAIRLYDRCGYQRYEIWRGYYADGEDAIVYQKHLVNA